MFTVLKARCIQGYRTGAFPAAAPNLPDRFQGRPAIEREKCWKECGKCLEVCPAGAIRKTEPASGIELDLGKCIFCGKCQKSCPKDVISFTQEYAMSTLKRELLVCRDTGEEFVVDRQENREILDLCGRSLKIRQVSAGGCAACELDFNVLNTLAWDMGRFGIQVVASPRHADCLLVTGPVSKNMLLALKKTYDAMAHPCFVIACGACAISGGIYAESEETCGGVESILKPDLYIPGCPPHPTTLLEGILRMMGVKY